MSKSKVPHLVCLGGSALLRAPGGDSLLGPGKPLAVLCYLALSPRRTATREHLIDLLWSDAEPDRARHVLRQTLWYIRQTVNDDLLITHEGELSLRPDITADRDEFLAAVNQGDLEAAVLLYRGDFLPGLAVPGGAAFDQWADVERYRLRAAFLRSAEALIRRQLGTGHARDALPLARRVRDAMPLSEQGWRLLLETHCAAADPVGAAMEADALEQLLGAEGREPEPLTRALLRVARRAPADVSTPEHGLVAELVGREREFSRIVHCWEEATRRRGRHVHVVSPAGFGKTRLLAEVQARLRAGGGRVVALRAAPGERHVTGSLIGDLARVLAPLPGAAGVSPSAAGTLVALHPAVSSFYSAPADLTTGEDALRRRTAALVELVAAVADEGPLAVILDDLHWADRHSRAVLAALSGRIAKEPVLLVTSARTGAPADPPPADGARLTLDPLTVPQVRALLASIGRLPDEPWVDGIVPLLHETAAGSPLLVLETLQLALERGHLALTDGTWKCREPDALKRQLRSGSALRHRVAALDRTSAWLLVVLAVAGTPLSLDQLARVTHRAGVEVEPVLTQLELRGLVARMGDEWVPGHDEIGALAVEIAPPAAVKAADKELGQVWLTDAESDPALLVRAGPHLAAAEEWSGLERAYGTWVRRARRRGDRRALRELAGDMLGGAVDAGTVRRLVRSLPRRFRVGLDRPSRMAAAVGVFLVVAAGLAAALRTSPPPDMDLVAFLPRTGAPALARTAGLRRAGWSGMQEIQPAAGRPWLHIELSGTVPVARPGTGEWVYARGVQDSGTIDLFLARPGLGERRLTFARGDDEAPFWAPDGGALVFTSARWSPLSHYNLGIIDPRTGQVRRLSRTDATDQPGGWSPDGSRIAFTRTYWSTRPPDVCWMTPDGAKQRCRPGPEGPVDILGWLDPRHVLYETNLAHGGMLAVLDLDGADRPRVIAKGIREASLSPDGRWLATLEGAGSAAWMVRPLDALDDPRPLALGPDASLYSITWQPTTGTLGWTDGLELGVPDDTASVGVPTRLRVVAHDSAGHVVDLPVLEFSSDDSTLVSVDSNGVLLPRRAGVGLVRVSAGGWLAGALRIPIAPSTFRALAAESWQDSFSRFEPFGDPLPRIVSTASHGRAFWNNGDSSYPSGAHSRRWFSARRGLGVEFQVSAPITMSQWQDIDVTLAAGIDSTALAQWDHKTNAPPMNRDYERASCDVGMPAGEGPTAMGRVSFYSGGESSTLRAPALVNGSWHRVRLQIFPDGTCGMAVDGRVVRILDSALPMDRPYVLMLLGKSVRTRILVGSLSVWEGVRPGIDWSRVPSSQARR